MSKLILVKHALPQIDPAVPAKNWKLSDEGRARCVVLADKLARHAPGVVVSSTEPKAQETGRIVAARLNIPFETAPGLHEHERQNVPFTDQAQFETSMAEFFANPQELVFGEETAAQAYGRFSKAVMAAMKRHAPKDIIICTHGTVLTLFVSRVANKKPFDFWRQLGLPAFVVLSVPEFIIRALEASIE